MPQTTGRCPWCGTDPLYVHYHDTVWGRPEYDNQALFEKLILDGFQAGLSWITILRKREAFRDTFAGFDPDVIATWGESDVARLLQNPGIVRHRGKIESTINNAKRALELRQEFGSLAAFVWQFEPTAAAGPQTRSEVMDQTAESAAMNRELKSRGWSFVGPTTMYAFMQAAGIVNDHMPGCAAGEACRLARKRFRIPSPSLT